MSAVAETSERMVFSVRSSRFPEITYRVDLTANNGAAFCSCTDWACRRSPALKAGGTPWTAQTTCRHVKQAGAYFLRHLLQAMAKSEGNT